VKPVPRFSIPLVIPEESSSSSSCSIYPLSEPFQEPPAPAEPPVPVEPENTEDIGLVEPPEETIENIFT